MDLGIARERAVIVGGAQGIGLATAKAFVAEGAQVVLLDRSERVVEIARSISADPQVACGLAADIRSPEAIARSCEAVSAAGGLDHLVVAAAIGSGRYGYPFTRLEPEDWERVFEVNVHGTVRCVDAFTPLLVERGEGSITLLSSVAAAFGSPTDPPYSASKAAIDNFTLCAARDLAAEGLRVNSVRPGMVKTALNRSVWQAWHDSVEPARRRSYEDWADEKVKEVVPLGRWQEPEDVANLIVFLASKRGRNITGQCLHVDGGYVMR